MQLPFYGVDLLTMEFYNIQEYLGIAYQTQSCLAHALNLAVHRMFEYKCAPPIVYPEEDIECIQLQAEDDEVIPLLLDHGDDL
ncbi:hypothetical protein VKT23_019554 [Stygiomarasmius scandens]|uniref:Uncharacterized protein n=1 Tax=Marasmiellus scandens TaxID=2682957 RepID=A0ABR1IP12_9AGAR